MRINLIKQIQDFRFRKARPPGSKPLFVRFGRREEIFFAKRLAMILRSGLPLLDAMKMLLDERSSASSRYVHNILIADISRGQTLSSSMRSLRSVFGDFAIGMVQVGESSGSLHGNLQYLAEELKKKDTLNKKVLGALIYPTVIVVATLGISVGLIVYLFPKIIPIFKSLGSELPWSTRSLLFASDVLINHGWEIVIGCVVFVGISVYALRRPAIRIRVDGAILHIPILGTLSQVYNLSNVARTLSTLLNGGMHIVPALQIAAECNGNLLYRRALLRIAADVERGQSISQRLQVELRLFPPLFAQMIFVGERTGNLAGSFAYLSDVHEEDLSDLTRNMTTLLEPILMIGMGLIVGFIAISIITPIYGITQNLNAYH